MIDPNEILAQMNANQRINYDKVMQKVIAEWQKKEIRPTILLHSCCAPCSTSSLERLTDHADVTIYFANANIYPRSEYTRRKLVQEEFIETFNKKTGHHVHFLAADYNPGQYLKIVREKKLEAEPEGGKRCAACFEMRLDQVADKARQLGYDYFGSALTLSPRKDSQLINSIGIEVQSIYQTRYLPSDFKKNNGYQRSIEICKEYAVYRQCYCGCVFSAKQQGVDLKKVNREARDFIETRKQIRISFIDS